MYYPHMFGTGGQPCFECGGHVRMQAGGPADFQPHTMYNPQTGEAFPADTYEAHLRMQEMGYVHEDQLQSYRKGGNWLQNIKSTGECTGKNFGGPKCPPGSRKYAFAKRARAGEFNKAAGGNWHNDMTFSTPGYKTGGASDEALQNHGTNDFVTSRVGLMKNHFAQNTFNVMAKKHEEQIADMPIPGYMDVGGDPFGYNPYASQRLSPYAAKYQELDSGTGFVGDIAGLFTDAYAMGDRYKKKVKTSFTNPEDKKAWKQEQRDIRKASRQQQEPTNKFDAMNEYLMGYYNPETEEFDKPITMSEINPFLRYGGSYLPKAQFGNMPVIPTASMMGTVDPSAIFNQPGFGQPGGPNVRETDYRGIDYSTGQRPEPIFWKDPRLDKAVRKSYASFPVGGAVAYGSMRHGRSNVDYGKGGAYRMQYGGQGYQGNPYWMYNMMLNSPQYGQQMGPMPASPYFTPGAFTNYAWNVASPYMTPGYALPDYTGGIGSGDRVQEEDTTPATTTTTDATVVDDATPATTTTEPTTGDVVEQVTDTTPTTTTATTTTDQPRGNYTGTTQPGFYPAGDQSVYMMYPGAGGYGVDPRMLNYLQDYKGPAWGGPAVAYNPADTYLDEYLYKGRMFGKGPRKIKMKFSHYRPDGTPVEVPVEEPADTPTADTPTADTPTADTPTADTPTADTPTADTTATDTTATNGDVTAPEAGRQATAAKFANLSPGVPTTSPDQVTGVTDEFKEDLVRGARRAPAVNPAAVSVPAGEPAPYSGGRFSNPAPEFPMENPQTAYFKGGGSNKWTYQGGGEPTLDERIAKRELRRRGYGALAIAATPVPGRPVYAEVPPVQGSYLPTAQQTIANKFLGKGGRIELDYQAGGPYQRMMARNVAAGYPQGQWTPGQSGISRITNPEMARNMMVAQPGLRDPMGFMEDYLTDEEYRGGGNKWSYKGGGWVNPWGSHAAPYPGGQGYPRFPRPNVMQEGGIPKKGRTTPRSEAINRAGQDRFATEYNRAMQSSNPNWELFNLGVRDIGRGVERFGRGVGRGFMDAVPFLQEGGIPAFTDSPYFQETEVGPYMMNPYQGPEEFYAGLAAAPGDPYAETDVTYKRKSNILSALGQNYPQTAAAASTILEQGARRAAREKLEQGTMGDFQFKPQTEQKRGDYDPISGRFRLDDMTMVEQPGYNVGSAFSPYTVQHGGDIQYLTDDEIATLKASGAKIEYLD